MKRVIKFPLYIIFVVVVLVAAVAYVYYFTTLPESEINNWLRLLAGKNLNLEISFQKINRDLWKHLEIEGVEVTAPDGSNLPLVYISKLTLDYKIADILKGNYGFNSLKIDSLYARIPNEDFKFAAVRKQSTGKPTPLSLEIGEIFIATANLNLRDGSAIMFDTIKSSLHVNNGNLELWLGKISATWPARNIMLNSLSGRIRSLEAGYFADSLIVDLGNSHLNISGKLGKSVGHDFDLQVSGSPVNFEDVENITGIRLNGSLDVTGTLKGSLADFHGDALVDGTFIGKPFENVSLSYGFRDKVLSLGSVRGLIIKADINGSAKFNFGVKPEEYSYIGRVKHLDLRQIGPRLQTDFSGQVHLAGRGFSEKQFAMNLDCSLDSVRVDSFYFDEVSGPVAFDLKKISFLPGFQGRYKNTYINATGSLEYLGALNISGGVEFDDLTDFTGQIFLRELGGKGNANFHITGPTNDFDVDASFASDSCWTYGLYPDHISIDAQLKSFISHQVGRVHGNWTGGNLYSLATDSGYFDAGVSGDRAFLDSVLVRGPLGLLALKGDYNGTTIPPVFSADTVYGVAAGNAFFSRQPLAFDIRENQTDFQRFVMGLGTGSIEITGSVTNDLKLDLDVKASSFQIQPIVEQFYKDKILRGIWWGDAKMRGDFEHPRIEFNLAIDSLSINNVALGSLNAQLFYDNGYIHTDSTHILSNNGEYNLFGDLPIDLSFGEVKTRLPNDPIDLRMIASGSRLLLAEIFIPSVERFETDFDVEMNLGGTYQRPTVSGSGRLVKGQLKVLDLFNPLADVKVYFRMENETVFIDSAMALMRGGAEWLKPLGELIGADKNRSPDQVVRASGTMRLITLGNFEYDIDVSGKNIYFVSDAYNVSGLADSRLRILGEKVPTVQGDITLKRLEVRDEFDKFVPPEYNPNVIIEDSILWNLDLQITAANNLWIRNSNVDGEMKGDIHVERQLGIMSILGSLDFIRGSYSIPGWNFVIKSGTMQFNNVSTINPDIDFTVITPLRSNTQEAVGPQVTSLEMRITGTLLEPRVDVASGSVLSKEDLLRYLIAGSPASQFAKGGGSKSLLQSLPSTLPTFIPGLTGVGIVDALDISQTEEGKTQISLAKYISRSLYVRYSQRLSQQSGTTIGVEYYLNNNVSLNVTRGSQGTQENEGISFDLNLNFEF